MADSKISALAAVTDVLGADEFVLARTGTTKKITGDSMRANLGGLVPMPLSFSGSADADFNGTVSPYVQVNGGTTAVSLVETTTTVQRADVATLPGWLLIQVGHAVAVDLRRDYTLADGESIVMPVMVGAPNGGDNMKVQLTLNDNDAGGVSGAYFNVGLEQDTTAWEVQSYSSVDTTGVEVNSNPMYLGQTVFLRICRIGTTYAAFASQNGLSWHYIYRQTGVATPYSNIWIYVFGPSSSSTYMPIVAIPWMKVIPNTAVSLAA